MKSRYIAAIEIGSSKIRGIVASVDDNSAPAVIAVEETDSGDSVRHGRVQNAREVATRVNELIRRLENNPRLAGGRITSVFVSEGGRSMQSRQASAELRFPGDVEITSQILDKLHREARYNMATDHDVLAVSDRRFVVGNTTMKKVIGTFGNAVRGEFTFVTASPDNRRNLDRVKIESHQTDIPRHYVPRAVALSNMVLSDAERQRGVLLIDFGAETTTLAVYDDDALQLMATLPMGSDNITRDLANGLRLTADAAENLKITKGRAVAERVKNPDPDPEVAEIINYVSSRTGEIIANVVNYINHAGIKLTDLAGGIVIAGGGSKLVGLADMIQKQANDLHVRQAVIDSTIARAPYNSPDYADVIAMVKYAIDNYDVNCIEFPVTEQVAEFGPSVAEAAAPRQTYDENDPRLLLDDEEADELPEPGIDADTTRRTLLERFRSWLTQPKDTDLDNEDENEDLD